VAQGYSRIPEEEFEAHMWVPDKWYAHRRDGW
jgi:hypothetical protein